MVCVALKYILYSICYNNQLKEIIMLQFLYISYVGFKRKERKGLKTSSVTQCMASK